MNTVQDEATNYLATIGNNDTDNDSSIPPVSNKRKKKKVHVIMGNQAGDADSIISSLTLGYYNYKYQSSDDHHQSSDDHHQETANSSDKIVLPIVSIPRSDMKLRRDVMLLLELAGVNDDTLLYMDDDIVTSTLLLPPPSSSTSKSTTSSASAVAGIETTITLVDHNRITSQYTHLSNKVIEIIDHHEDEHYHLHKNVTIESGKRDVAYENGMASVASTCTLIVERLFASSLSATTAATTATTTSAGKIDGSLGILLLGVILLDSINMLPAAGKGTLRDERAIQLLLQQTDWTTYCEKKVNKASLSSASSSASLVDADMIQKIFSNEQQQQQQQQCIPDRSALFDILSGAKNDPQFWLDLSLTDCLRLDYKKFVVANDRQQQQSSSSMMKEPTVSSIGISSVLLSMDKLLLKSNFMTKLETFVTSSNIVDLFGIMTLDFTRSGEPKRELLLASTNMKVIESYTNFLSNHSSSSSSDVAELEMIERKECIVDDDDDNEVKGNGNNGGDRAASLYIRVFRQGNGKKSRKQIAPILLGYATSLLSGSKL